MSDLIDREAAIDAIKKSRYLLEAMKKVIKLPPAEPERKRGRWMGTVEDWRHQVAWWKCSECGMDVSTQYNFCPSCGADMRGEEQDG